MLTRHLRKSLGVIGEHMMQKFLGRLERSDVDRCGRFGSLRGGPDSIVETSFIYVNPLLRKVARVWGRLVCHRSSR